jgi:hypothetical protein
MHQVFVQFPDQPQSQWHAGRKLTEPVIERRDVVEHLIRVIGIFAMPRLRLEQQQLIEPGYGPRSGSITQPLAADRTTSRGALA